jgi:Flp pilus assembly pilin Flp
MGRFFRRCFNGEGGQSATEYMLIIAVVVLGLMAAASKLIPRFQRGVEKLGETIETEYLSNAPDFEKVEK